LDLINSLAQAYAERYSSPEDPALSRVASDTMSSHAHAHMLSGHLQGKFLQFISTLVRPLNILEIGTFTGYSAIYLSKGLQPGGKLHTIELRDEEVLTARQNFNIAGVQDKIILHAGNALEIIPSLKEQWDLVFIDADKVNYIAYYRLVLPALRKGGVILADNVLFHGEVLEERIKGKNALAVQAFNEYVLNDGTVDAVILTIRDGLSFIIKK
jgi:predicted O-methyltransferase YrrM